jgi:hypothetical protein
MHPEASSNLPAIFDGFFHCEMVIFGIHPQRLALVTQAINAQPIAHVAGHFSPGYACKPDQNAFPVIRASASALHPVPVN